MRRTVAMLASSMLIVTALAAGGTPVGAANSQPAQRYIVVLDDDADSRATARQHARSEGAQVELIYRHALAGYSATMSPAAAARIAQRAEVRSVEADQQVSVTAQTIPTGIPRTFATSNGNLDIDGTDDWRVDADVAVIDTGIDLDHPDLNVVASTDCRYNSGGSPWTRTYWCDSGGNDGNGHGTHVGGTIGAIDDANGVVGIAPGVRLWAVKVLDDNGSGSMSAVVAGVDYVASNAASIEVANMSLGCSCSSTALDDALDGARAKGVTFAVSAGNSDADASGYSPASNVGALTVSALADFDGAPGGLVTDTSSYCRSDQDDTLADFSNWGSLVDITAPGVCILSTYKDGGYATISGTSMSSPHVAGAAAVLASAHSYGTERDGADVTTIQNTLVSEGNLNWTDDSGDGIKERLLDLSDTGVFAPVKVAGSGGTSEPEANAAPVGYDDTASTTPGQAVEIAVLANDTDANDDTLTVTNLTQPASGTGSAAYDSSTKKVTYTPPDSTWTGTTSFTYTPHDGTVAGNTTTVTVTVAEAPAPSSLDVSVGYATEGGRLNNQHLLVTVTVMEGTAAASGASVSVAITTGSTTATGTGTTGPDGKVTFKWTNAPSGSYTTDVTRVVTADGTDHGDVAETDPGFTK